eukprot:TRINITY_DN16189_c0_g1_i1.p1 TRINITY_DN16189_c0_g1~~TRINITY_DN16189_c0_g1_i1.p1  ORF type:complete len:180 (+),score=21.92 TRINITY_DN16189_c0_g1_i1:34-540(+)
MAQIASSLVPNSPLTWLTPNFAPVVCGVDTRAPKFKEVREAVKAMIDPKSSLVYWGKGGGSIIKGFAQFSGLDRHAVASQMTSVTADYETYSNTSKQFSNSAALLQNHSGISHILERLDRAYSRMFKRKAFLHWYKGEGMDEMEFKEAYQGLKDRISAYRLIQNQSTS